MDAAGIDYEYSNNDGTWQDAVEFTIKAGGGYSIKARNRSTSCVSTAAVCTGEASATSTTKTSTVIEKQLVSTPTPIKEIASLKGVETININMPSKTLASAGPNPFSDKIRFSIQSGASGRGSLDLYNMIGQKVKTVFEGYVEAGKSRIIEYHVPASQRTNLTWVFTVGEQKVSGKLVGIK